MYLYGTQAWISCLSMACAYVMSAYVFVPMMYNLRITSMFKVNMNLRTYLKTLALVSYYISHSLVTLSKYHTKYIYQYLKIT